MPRIAAACSTDLVGDRRELDTAGFATPADLHLGLDDDWVPDRVGLADGLVDGVGHAAGRDRNTEAGEVLLALVLEEIHEEMVAPACPPRS